MPNERLEIRQNLPLVTLALELRNCALFLGHDSGISHLAAALGVPSLLLYGPTDPAVWAPRNRGVRILRAPGLTMEGIALCDVITAFGEIMS